jgi:hypothetical protein
MIKLKFVRPKLPAPNNDQVFSLADAKRLIQETDEVMAIIDQDRLDREAEYIVRDINREYPIPKKQRSKHTRKKLQHKRSI